MIATPGQVSDAARLIDALERQGGPDAIAAYLYVEDCKGVPRDPRSCPVALYLDFYLDGPPVVVVGSYYRIGELRAHERAIPANVHRFIQLFDSGVYPELVAESSC